MKRGGPLPRRKAMRRISSKRAAIQQERAVLRMRLLVAHPVCQVCKEEPSTEIHERLTRARGGSILDEENCVAVGRKCHALIHENPKWATENGWLRSAYSADAGGDEILAEGEEG